MGQFGEAPPGWHWVVAEDSGDLAFGSLVEAGPVQGVAVVSQHGRRALLRLGSGLNVFAILVEAWRVDLFRRTWRGRDIRILPVLASGVGQGLSVAENAKEEPVNDFALKPRTTAWCVNWLIREGGPVQHHETWKSRKKLTASDFGVAEHHTLSTILEDLATTDQVDVCNLLGAERLVRKLQMIEHFWDERQREQDVTQQKMPMEEVNAFMGGVGAGARPSSMVCPTMMDHIGKELERVGNIKKNARKLREESKGTGKGAAADKK